MRIQALDVDDAVRGCGTGYLTRSAQIVTAFHVLVPPNASLCGNPTGEQVNITKYRITTSTGAVIDVGCADFETVPLLQPDSRRPSVDVGFLRVSQHMSAQLQVPDGKVDGFVDDVEFDVENGGRIVGYLDDACQRADLPPVTPQAVVLGTPRTVRGKNGAGEYIIIDHPEKPGTSGSPVVWRGTNRVIGIYVGRQEVDDTSEGTEGLVVSFDTPYVRDNYRALTGDDLSTETLTPKRIYLGAGFAYGKPFGWASSAFGGGAFLAAERWSWFTWSLGFAGSFNVLRSRVEWEYRDPLGEHLDTDSRSITDWATDFALEARLLRRLPLQLVVGVGARVHFLPELDTPAGLEALHWGLVGFGRVGLELPIQGFVLRAIADAGYGWVPNTVVRYSGIGSGLSFVDGSSSTTSPSFQGVASVGYTL